MSSASNDRRAFLKLASGGALLIPFAVISACSKQEPGATPAPAAAPAAAPEPVAAAAPAATPEAAATPPVTAPPVAGTATAAAANLPHLDPGDPVAKSLGYHQDASTIDAAKFPRHVAGQACRKCVQFKGGAADEWGPCTIFIGKQVNANGWCTAFAARA
jgi:hypothetical protein